MTPPPKKINKKEACPGCLRPLAQCFCQKVSVVDNHLRVLILQHPQEQYKLLNSALLAHKALTNSLLRVGLSWRNLNHALGEEVNRREWGVLFLGALGASRKPLEIRDDRKRLLQSLPKLKGLVVIDGSWKQAKTLWWRNPWLLRLNRISLNPRHPSLRPQVKKEGLSTIEAIALAMGLLGESKETGPLLINQYEMLIINPVQSDFNPSRNR